MENERLEVAKKYVDMVKRHNDEALEMTKELARTEMTKEDEAVFYEVANYGKSLNTKMKLAQYFYAEIVRDVIGEEAIEEIEEI